MKVDCSLSEYTEHIQGVDDSELLDVLGHICKTSFPDRYEAVVQECKRRGLIVEDGDRRQIREHHSDRLARKMGTRGHIKRTIILLLLICGLSAIPIGIGIWHGLKHGFFVGLICFLIYGGIEWLGAGLWTAATWPEDNKHKEPQKP